MADTDTANNSIADSSRSANVKTPELHLRPSDTVMRLSRMGAFHQSRLSFIRVLLRKLKQENWTFERSRWQITANGTGVATYTAHGPERSYTLIAFAHDLPDEARSDRVIAEAWDATFTLFDGLPTDEDIERLMQQVPLQEAGRLSDSELVLSRANRSVRLFESVCDALANGRQPDIDEIEAVGYLMRTTAVYGSGKFGAADRSRWAERPEFKGSFQPELLSVWLIRTFTLDLVEHMAQARAPESATRLVPEIRRRFGVGNSTGLGMAPFLLNHPVLLNNWIEARETALARVRDVNTIGQREKEKFLDLLSRVQINVSHWSVDHQQQMQKINDLAKDLDRMQQQLKQHGFADDKPWDDLYRWAESMLSLEAQEQLVSLLIELYPQKVDELASGMCCDENTISKIDATGTVAELKTAIRQHYLWAIENNFERKASIARVWYVSAEKLEPRLGERFEEDIEPYEQPLSPARDIARLYDDLGKAADDSSLAAFLMQHPEHRHSVRRLQTVQYLPYAEIRDNTIAAEMLPIDMLRCKLSFFGATRFDPRSDRWVRITLFKDAPFPDELALLDPDELAYPPANSAQTVSRH